MRLILLPNSILLCVDLCNYVVVRVYIIYISIQIEIMSCNGTHIIIVKYKGAGQITSSRQLTMNSVGEICLHLFANWDGMPIYSSLNKLNE